MAKCKPDARRNVQSQRFNDEEIQRMGSDANRHIRGAALLIAKIRPKGVRFATVDDDGGIRFHKSRPLTGEPVEL